MFHLCSSSVQLTGSGSVHENMPRPRLHESTVEAVTLVADAETNFDANKFDIDTRVRMALYHAMLNSYEVDFDKKRVKKLLEPYDV